MSGKLLHYKNVLQVSSAIRYVWRFACVWRFANWKNVVCHKMCIVTRMANTYDARVARSYHKNFPVSRYLPEYDL